MNTPRYLSTQINWATPEVANAFDSLPFWAAPFGNLFFEHVPLRAGIKVLDVGFGTGFPLLELAARLGPESQVFGIDSWSDAVAVARRKAKALQTPVEIVEADASQMPFEDNQFDMVVSHLGINNFEQKDQVLRECIRVMKKNATLVLVTNLEGTFREFYQLFYQTLNELRLSQYIPYLKQQEAHRQQAADIRAWLVKHGFSIQKTVSQKHHLRYLNGTAFLNHFLVLIGFLPAWLDLFPKSEHLRVFTQLEENLNKLATQDGEMRLEIPMFYVEGRAEEMRK